MMMTKIKTTKIRLANKNLLFAELIVVVLFFSLAMTACVTLFAGAYKDGQQSSDLTNAVIMAQNTAELMKATGRMPPAVTEEDGLQMQVEAEVVDGILEAVITVSNPKDNSIIYELKVGVLP